MNRQIISIQLEELIFDRENQDLLEAHLPGGNLGFNKAKQIGKDAYYDDNDKAKDLLKYGKNKLAGKNIEASRNIRDMSKKDEISNKVGGLAQGGLAAAYVGGAYLLYKGIKVLYKKLKAADTPEQKAAIKTQIASKKVQLQKAKQKG